MFDDTSCARTWDGEPIAPDPPFGAAIVVFRENDAAGGLLQFLLLHRVPRGTDDDGAWAWGPPAGARHPGEPLLACATRELREETGPFHRAQMKCCFPSRVCFPAPEATHGWVRRPPKNLYLAVSSGRRRP
jgi:hypothetical protein